MMKKLSLQWRLTIITTLFIAVICGCLTMFIYRNGVYYIDTLKDAVDAQGSEAGGEKTEEIYIDIPDDKWDDFANNFSVQVYNSKADYRKRSLLFSALMAILGGVVTYFISGRALRPLCEFSDKIEEVQAQNLADSRIEENKVKELKQLSVSYNRMLDRLSEAFEVQRQFTANAAHELRTPLAVIQAQLDMSELQTVARDEKIELDALVEEVLADLEPLALKKDIKLIGKCDAVTMMGSDILIYRLVYNLVENAIKYNKPCGQVTVTAAKQDKYICLAVSDTGNGIPEELKERVFEPFFRVDKSRSRALGGVGLGLALVHEIVRVHGGSISVKDNHEGGTIFEVLL